MLTLPAVNTKEIEIETGAVEHTGGTFDDLSLYVICGLWAAHHLFFLLLAKHTFDQRRALDVPQIKPGVVPRRSSAGSALLAQHQMVLLNNAQV